MNKEIINDQKETIHRLQQECTEKTNAIIALGERLQTKEQECEDLKRQYKELGQCSKRLKDYYDKEKETLSNRFLKLKQTLAEIKEIAEGMHDLWINKTPYTDINNLVEHLIECELNRIRYKLDEISECEAEE